MRECEEEQENQDLLFKRIKRTKAAGGMRLKAMESSAESKAWKWASLSDDDESLENSKKRQSSGSDTFQYLSKKAENDRELKI